MLTKSHIIYTNLRLCASFTKIKHVRLKHLPRPRLSSNSSIIIPIRFIGSAAEQKNPSRKKDEIDFPEKKICVYTCENVYEKWKKEERVFKLPLSGVHADISYIDTIDLFKENGSKPIKTVLCIHGIPGNYGVFSYLIRDLVKEGVRVVVPTFPGICFFFFPVLINIYYFGTLISLIVRSRINL